MSFVNFDEILELGLDYAEDRTETEVIHHQGKKRRQEKPVGVMVTDRETNILYVNKGFTEITQYKEEEAKGQTPRILKSGLYSPFFYKLMWRSLKLKNRWQGIIWDRRKNGSLYLIVLEIQAITNHTGEVTHYRGQFIELDGLREAFARLLPIPEFEERVLLPSMAEGNRK